MALLALYFGTTFYISGKNRETLLEEATQGIQEITSSEVANINGKLQEVSRLARIVQLDQEAYFAKPGQCVLPNGEPSFAKHANGAFYKTRDNGGSSLSTSRRSRLESSRWKISPLRSKRSSTN